MSHSVNLERAPCPVGCAWKVLTFISSIVLGVGRNSVEGRLEMPSSFPAPLKSSLGSTTSLVLLEHHLFPKWHMDLNSNISKEI